MSKPNIVPTLYEHFKKKNFYPAEIWEDGGKIHIQINWGDWKHDHLYCKYLMQELNYIEISNCVTEEDGLDTYSSEHIFVRKDL